MKKSVTESGSKGKGKEKEKSKEAGTGKRKGKGKAEETASVSDPSVSDKRREAARRGAVTRKRNREERARQEKERENEKEESEKLGSAVKMSGLADEETGTGANTAASGATGTEKEEPIGVELKESDEVRATRRRAREGAEAAGEKLIRQGEEKEKEDEKEKQAGAREKADEKSASVTDAMSLAKKVKLDTAATIVELDLNPDKGRSSHEPLAASATESVSAPVSASVDQASQANSPSEEKNYRGEARGSAPAERDGGNENATRPADADMGLLAETETGSAAGEGAGGAHSSVGSINIISVPDEAVSVGMISADDTAASLATSGLIPPQADSESGSASIPATGTSTSPTLPRPTVTDADTDSEGRLTQSQTQPPPSSICETCVPVLVVSTVSRAVPIGSEPAAAASQSQSQRQASASGTGPGTACATA